MTTFKAFLRVLQKNLVVIIISTITLLIFGGFSMQAGENNGSYIADKPSIAIINHDKGGKIAQALHDYLVDKCEMVELPDDENEIKDALFYRKISLAVYIPENYSADYMAGQVVDVEYQGSNDYGSALAQMILERFLKVMEVYREEVTNDSELIAKTQDVIKDNISVEMVSSLDVAGLKKAAAFFNFESYALLNSLVFVIAVIMMTFNNKKVHQRLLVSSTDPAKQGRILFWANLGLAMVIWLAYLGLGFIMLGVETLISWQGLCFIANSFIFMMCATALACLVGYMMHNKDALNGITNVIALGSSFLCGAFVPQMWLPESVLAIAHVLPTYYYIAANEQIVQAEMFDVDILINMGIVLLFALGLVVLAGIAARKRKD